jgi:protein-disulfide isomerase
MLRQLSFLIIAAGLACYAGAQQKPTARRKTSALAAKSAAPPAKMANSDVRLPSEDMVNGFMQDTFGYDSSITWRILEIKPSEAEGLAEVLVLVSNPRGQETSRFFVSPDGQHALLGEVIPFGTHPFAAAKEKLDKGVTGPSRGPAKTPVTVVEFSDLQCPHCKAAQPTLEKLIGEEPNVRLVFQNFPLPSHDWAAKGAAYGDCVASVSNDAFWKFLQGTYDAQTEITAATADEKLTAIADKAGVKGSEIAACAAKPETVARVEQSVALGKSVDVSSTPSIFVNGRKIGSIEQMPYEVLKKLVEYSGK